MVESQIPKKIGDGMFKRKTKTAQWNPSSEPRKTFRNETAILYSSWLKEGYSLSF